MSLVLQKLKEYQQIIDNALIENRQKGGAIYYESHHILPACANGPDDEWNRVLLTAQEHYRVHEILPYIYTEGITHNKLVYGWNRMKSLNRDIIVDAELYAELREEHSKIIAKQTSELQTGQVICKSLVSGERFQVSQDEFDKNSDLVGVNHGSDINKGKSKTQKHKKALSDSNINQKKIECVLCGTIIKNIGGNMTQHKNGARCKRLQRLK